MIDINLLRRDPDAVRENIRKKFQDKKLPLVDEVLALDEKRRALQKEGDERRAARNAISAKIGKLMREKDVAAAEAAKAEAAENNARIAAIEKEAEEIAAQLKKDMMSIPNIIAPEVPVGRDDTENVERRRFLEPAEKPFEVPYHLTSSKICAASTSTAPAARAGRGSTICSATSPACIPPSSPTRATS